jgi:hypothetical protein
MVRDTNLVHGIRQRCQESLPRQFERRRFRALPDPKRLRVRLTVGLEHAGPQAEIQYYLTPSMNLDTSASTNYGNEIKLQWHKEY